MGKEINNVVNHPSHYTDGKFEVIDFMDDSGVMENACLANAVKYISRAGKKDKNKTKEDLQKASWYLGYFIKKEYKNPSAECGISVKEYCADKKLSRELTSVLMDIILTDNVTQAKKTLDEYIDNL